jgi:tetratricopeptide (TPR) repeat protein
MQNVMLVVGVVAASYSRLLVAVQSENKEAVPSKEAEALHTKAREAGAKGDYAAALALLTKAATLAPGWPYPIYDRAFARLLMDDRDGALADYERTLKLSPRGFFTAHVAVDTLRREQKGEFPRGFYRAYTMLEHMEASQRRAIVRQLVETAPSFAPGWLDYEKLADTPQERLRRIERGLAAKPDTHTYGMLKLNQAFVLQQLGQSAAAEGIFKDLASNPKSTADVEAWAKVWLTKK